MSSHFLQLTPAQAGLETNICKLILILQTYGPMAEFGQDFGDGKYVDSCFQSFFIFVLHCTGGVGMWLLEPFFCGRSN